MNCHICGHVIPEGQKYCPGCGRVVKERATKGGTEQTVPKTGVGAGSASTKPTSYQDTGITDIFNTDPNAPEYSDPYAYDRASAHAEEYDRLFVSRKNENIDDDSPLYTDSGTKRFKPIKTEPQDDESGFTRRIHIKQETDDDDDSYSLFDVFDDDDDDDDGYDDDSAPQKEKRPINFKMIFLGIAITIGIVIVVAGIYSIGKSVGIWGEEPTSTAPIVDASNLDSDNVVNKNEQKDNDEQEDPQASMYKTGVYTVKSTQKNIFVYKSVADQRIIATIPNNTIIKITEVNGDFGKTSHNSYVGWVEMAELKFTPNEAPETTTKQEETTTEPTSGENQEEPTFPTKPGNYTVVTTTAGLNVRNTNSTEGDIITVIPNGETVEVMEVKSGWGKIYMDGAEAWVYMKYLK